MNSEQELSKEELQDYPVKRFEGEICVVNSYDQIPGALREMSNCKVLGFDTETRPAFRKE